MWMRMWWRGLRLWGFGEGGAGGLVVVRGMGDGVGGFGGCEIVGWVFAIGLARVRGRGLSGGRDGLGCF